MQSKLLIEGELGTSYLCTHTAPLTLMLNVLAGIRRHTSRCTPTNRLYEKEKKKKEFKVCEAGGCDVSLHGRHTGSDAAYRVAELKGRPAHF